MSASPEPRTWCALYQLEGLGLVEQADVIALNNGFRSRFSDDFETLRATRLRELTSLGASLSSHNFDLFNNIAELRELARTSVASSNTIVVDISTMPKRVFFPLIKFLRNAPPHRLKNLLATYSIPIAYPPSSEPLVEDLTQMAPLPTFSPDVVDNVFVPLAPPVKIIVGLGFEIGTLPDFISANYQHPDLKVLFPIPPGPPYIHRNHELMRQLRAALGQTPVDVRQVSSLEVSETFEIIDGETQVGMPDLAPYGPKPMSLGMCLAAIKHGLAVYYAQPRAYNPQYSLGNDHRDPVQVNAYPIRVDGIDWY